MPQRSPFPIEVLLSCPEDADWVIRGLNDAADKGKGLIWSLEREWRVQVGTTLGQEIHTSYWKENSVNAWSLDGGQGAVNETLVANTDMVVAVFVREAGSEWTSAQTGESYRSGTAAEIELGSTNGRHARIYAASNTFLTSGNDPMGKREGRDPELQNLLDDYTGKAKADRKGSWFVREWDSYDQLVSYVWADIQADLASGAIRVRPQHVVIEPSSNARYLPHTYVPRIQESSIAAAWSAGHTTVSLVGDGGVGKSFIARRTFAEALAAGNDQPAVSIFIEPTTMPTVLDAYARAAEDLHLLLPNPEVTGQIRTRMAALEFANFLRTTDVPWLVVMDNADSSPSSGSPEFAPEEGDLAGTGSLVAPTGAGGSEGGPRDGRASDSTTPGGFSATAGPFRNVLEGEVHGAADPGGTVMDVLDDLYREGLLPPNSEHGRALITTRYRSAAVERHTEPVWADCFSPSEALAYLRQYSCFDTASNEELDGLAEEVDRLPLALSIIAATIQTERITVAAWLEAFRAADTLEHPTLDRDDPDHYPIKLARVWEVALAWAARGELVPGSTARAALACAVLSPTADPGWVWQTSELQDFLYQGETPPVGLGMPSVLQALERYSLLAVGPRNPAVGTGTTPGTGSVGSTGGVAGGGYVAGAGGATGSGSTGVTGTATGNVAAMGSGNPTATRATWPDAYLTMHRLTAKAIQGTVPEGDVEVAVRACADALLHFDPESPTHIREAADNLLALLRSRGREGLIIWWDDGCWSDHDLIADALDSAVGGLVQIDYESLSVALETILPVGSGSLAEARTALAGIALQAGDMIAGERLASTEFDPSHLSGDWTLASEAATVMSGAVRRANELQRDLSEPNGRTYPQIILDHIDRAEHPLLALVILRISHMMGLGLPEEAVSRVTDTLQTFDPDFGDVVGTVLAQLPPSVAESIASSLPYSVTPGTSPLERLLLPVPENAWTSELEARWLDLQDRAGIASPLTWQARIDYANALVSDGQSQLADDIVVPYFEQIADDSGVQERFRRDARLILADWLGHHGDRPRAIKLLSDLIEDVERSKEQQAMHRILSLLADFLMEEERYSEAAERWRDLVERRRLVLGAHDPQTLAARHQHAYCLYRAGDKTNAINVYALLLPDRDQFEGATSDGALATLGSFANSLYNEGRYAEGAARYEDLAQRRAEALGDRDPQTLTARHWHAVCMSLAGDKAAAIDLYTKLLPDREQYEGTTSEGALAALNNLAAALQGEKRYVEAAERWDDLAQRQTGTLGADDPNTLRARHFHAYCLDMAGDKAAAIDVLAKLQSDIDQHEGRQSDRALHALWSLAVAIQDEKRYEEAAERWGDLARRRAETLGVDDPHTLAAKRRHALCIELAGDKPNSLSDKEQYLESAERWESAARWSAQQRGAHDPETLDFRHNQASCLSMAGNETDAIDLYAKLLPARDEYEGSTSEGALATLSNLANLLKGEGRYVEAAARYEDLSRRRAVALGVDDPQTLEARESQEWCLDKVREQSESE